MWSNIALILYKTILVPHAGTPAGDEALKHAIYAAEEISEIIILHIVEAIHAPPSFALSSSEREKLLEDVHKANEEIRKDMKQKMKQYDQQCKEKGVESKVKVEIGDAAEIILNTVEKEKVELIVMSKRRKLKGLKKLLSLGSVSRKIVENASCPVLLLDIEK